VVDEAVRRVLRVKFALGLFEHPYAEGVEVIAPVAEHRPLVRQAAAESLVLLRNEPAVGNVPVLPLSHSTKSIALIGPLADDSVEMVGSWAGAGNKKDVVTLKDAFEVRARSNGGSVLYAKGTEIEGRRDFPRR